MSTDAAAERERFKEIRAFIESHSKFLLLTHVGPDGDGLLASIAMSRYLRAIGKKGLVVTDGPAPAFLGPYDPEGLVRTHTELLSAEDGVSRFDAVLVIDTGKPSRLGHLEEPVRNSQLPLGVIDHHIREEGDFEGPSCIDASAAAVGEIVADFLEAEGNRFDDPLIVRLLLATLVYDTGQFRFTNTTPKTLNWAARLVELGGNTNEAFSIFWESNSVGSLKLMGHLMSNLHIECGGRLAWFTLSKAERERFGVNKEETEEYIIYPRSIASVEAIAFFSETENDRVRVSLRSKGRVKVHGVAVQFGGGGHAFAAGARERGSLEDVARLVTDLLAQEIRSTLGPD
ncbi:MAG: DHHA1 domain-containing protein [bacterium]|nr:DHHA1 domain-containing protein [bacterium]